MIAIRAAPLACAAALLPSAAWAAAGDRPSEAVFLIQLVLLLAVGRLLGEAMQRIGQPAVMGQLIGGILLGPSVFGALAPGLQHAVFPDAGTQKSMIDAVGQLGILMLLLLTGMETDLAVVRTARRAAVSVSLAGIVVPFACGFALGEMVPDSLLPDPGRRLITALFLGTALSISSVKIVAMVVRDVGFMRRRVGQVMVASAIVDDTVGWIIMAITFGLAQHGGIDLAGVARSVLGTALFLLASFTLGRRAVFLLIRWANDSFVVEMPVITMILVIAASMALLTDAIGVHSVLGAFVAGVLVGQSPILTRHVDAQLRGLIVALFMPVFFGLAGQSADLRVLADGSMLLLLGGMVAIASLGKFAGAFIGGRIGGMTPQESLALACGMNARGSTEVIVATLGLGMGVLSQGLFTTILAMAVLTTLAMPPMLRWALGRVALLPEEAARLQREAEAERSFVSNFERLLVAADDSPDGRLASRLAGLVAGLHATPVTVVPVGAEGGPDAGARSEAAQKAARQGESRADDPGAALPPEVVTRQEGRPLRAAIAEEARKGHDLLVIGLATREGAPIAPQAELAVMDFDRPFAIVSARGEDRGGPDRPVRNILVPLTGTGFSHRGAELALALARASDATVTAMHVGGPARSWPWRPGRHRQSSDRAMLQEIAALGEGQGVAVRQVAVRPGPVEDAILRQVATGGHDLVVMGVSRRAGAALYFGSVPEALMQRSGRSLVIVCSQS